jgi:rSAM/selenodomain-associated transferase 1
MSIGRRSSTVMAALSDTKRGSGPAFSGVIVVMAKEPEPGRVKTRLCPPLTPELAARCHEAFVSDALARLDTVARGQVDRQLAVTPAGAAPRLRALASARGWRCVEQEGADLGARMRGCLAAGAVTGAPVVLVGSDSPDLPVGRLVEAFLALRASPVVLGPASDGGYYLIGCRGCVPEVFGADMPWGTPAVLRETLARLAAAGTDVALLEPWPDVDDWRGLVALAGRLRSDVREGDEPAPQSTLRFLAELAGQGLAL